MVELAIILPLFMLLVFGVIQFGLTYNNLITLRQGRARRRDRAQSATSGARRRAP